MIDEDGAAVELHRDVLGRETRQIIGADFKGTAVEIKITPLADRDIVAQSQLTTVGNADRTGFGADATQHGVIVIGEHQGRRPETHGALDDIAGTAYSTDDLTAKDEISWSIEISILTTPAQKYSTGKSGGSSTRCDTSLGRGRGDNVAGESIVPDTDQRATSECVSATSGKG